MRNGYETFKDLSGSGVAPLGVVRCTPYPCRESCFGEVIVGVQNSHLHLSSATVRGRGKDGEKLEIRRLMCKA